MLKNFKRFKIAKGWDGLFRKVKVFFMVFILILTSLGKVELGIVYGAEYSKEDLQLFFAKHYGKQENQYFDRIWDVLSSHAPELTKLPMLDEPKIIIRSDFESKYSTDNYFIEFTILPVLESEKHLYVHLTGWGDLFREPSKEGSWQNRMMSVFLQWDDNSGSFKAIDVKGKIHTNDHILANVFHLDDEDVAVALSGVSGASGIIGDFAVYRYDAGMGYECVWHADNPFVYMLESHSPAQMVATELESWKGFPIYDLDALDTSSRYALKREYKVVYSWDARLGAFKETSRDEIFHEFAVVNHFMKSLKDGEFDKIVDYIVEDFDPHDPSFLENSRLLFSQHIVPRPFRATESLANLVGYQPKASSHLLAVVAIKEPKEIVWSIQNDQIESLAFFEFSKADPLKIRATHFYDLYELPVEMKGHIQEHPLPTKEFNKLGIQHFARTHSWDEANRRVKRPVRTKNIGDWLEIVSILRSPAVLYVEAHYMADLNFEPPHIADRYYENMLNEKTLSFFVSLRSRNKKALEIDVLRFVLSADSGQRWEGVFDAEKIIEETMFGITTYERTFWVDFDIDKNPINWNDEDSISLHLMRKDRLNRADLVWDFRL